MGLDKEGPVDLGAGGQRGRPKLNAARTTFVADNGQPLRGPYTSTEWTSATDYTNIANMKALGFNAVHLYGESFDPSYPTNGSTAPGYAINQIDSIVQSTRDLGLYLVITIGNGAANGNYNRAYITNFWNLYSARYANETHVMFEIQNEPVAWGPPYSSASATPPGALDMEVAAYRAIRANAPNTPVLLFTYAVLGDSGGASAALTDIHAFNTNVFGNANAVWTNEAVGFHGYAGASATSNAVSQIIAAGYPCFMTEFGGNVWGTGVGGLDPYAVADLERLGVSWLTFQYIPPTGVSDDVTGPQHYQNIVNWSGLSWTPDYGNWPPVRGPYGNGGYPWTTPDYNNNFLTGSLRIQAENFDSGGEGVAYHELTATNLGGQYRTSEAVDIETTMDPGGGCDVTGTAAGEWFEYTIYVSEPGLYNLALRVAGTSAGSVQVLAGGINGTNLTGAWIVPATGGAQTWTTISNTVFLTPGQQVLHLDVLAGGFNLNWLQLSPVTSGILADGSYKLLNRASAFAVTGVSASNMVNAAASIGATAQKWNFQNLGGGEYKITSAENGWSLVSGLGFYWWINNHYLIQSTGDGYYRIVPSGSGFCFETTASDPTVIDEKVSAGSVNQPWAILSPTAPAFPTGLSAVAAGSTTASLTWNAVTGATSYNLKRSTTNGGPYSIIASGVTATNYSDSGLAGGTTYYYVVSAMVSINETLNSAQATVTTPVPLLLLGRWLSGAANFIETSGYSPAGTFDGFAVASGSYYFTNDVPPNATGVSVRLNNSGIGISNTSLAWDSHYTNTFDNRINNSFTVTCWAKGLPGGWNPWVSKFGENEKGWQLRTDGSAPTYPCWTIRNNNAGTVTLGAAVYGNPEDMASRSMTVNDGKWHHYAGTFDAESGIRCLYVDGRLAAAETGNAPCNLAATNRLMLGARDGGSSTSSSGGYGSYFTGNLYDVRIYNSAASQTQVRNLAALSPPPLTNLVVGGGQMVLTWPWGTLLQATNLLGPWTPVQAASPYTNSPIAPQQFFRISNP